MFGFCGASGVGKSTLARKTAEAMHLHFHESSVTRLMKEGGFNDVADMPPVQRILAQEFVLTRYLQEIEKAPRPCITDRTPIDMLAYTLGEVTMHNTDPIVAKKIDAYVDRCLVEAMRHFHTIIILRPLPFYQADVKRPPPNAAYRWNIQFLCEGALKMISDTVQECTIFTHDLAERVECAKELIADGLKEIEDFKQTVTMQ
jgi:predicted ATPase